MQFDDRLATVLRHRAGGERAARTQYRQLLDLLGTRGESGDQSLLAAAWLRLAALSESIPSSERARMVSEPGLRFRSPQLALHLAEAEPDVASAALAKVQLSEADWTTLIPRLPVRARGFLRLRRDLPEGAVTLLDRLGVQDRGLPRPANTNTGLASPAMDTETVQSSPPASPAPPPPPPANDTSEIGELVRRIEAFNQSRSERGAGDILDPAEAPRLPLEELRNAIPEPPLTSFSFTTDVEGRIDWADLRVAPMVVGQRLDTEAMRDARLARQEIRGSEMRLHGAAMVAGIWTVHAIPRFTTLDGRFFGYAGKFRRDAPVEALAPAAPATQTPQAREADSLRQLLHELRTPINAIQGFAEVIQQQVFGPTPHEYRALAASIAGDSARMMAGFDEIDRLARLETGALDLEEGQTNFASVAAHQIERLQTALTPRNSGFDASILSDAPIAMETNEAEAMLWRLLATIAAAMGAGERLALKFTQSADQLALDCELPARLAAEDDVFTATKAIKAGPVTPGAFGPGFALRLARAEARAAGGDLARQDDRMLLTIPLLTAVKVDPSERETVESA